jgi:hypothetical protein
MLSGKPTFNDVVGALLALLGLAVLAYLAIVFTSEQAEGALISLLSAAVGYLYRGRVEKQTEPPPPPEGRNG